MDVKEQLAENIAEELLDLVKLYCPTDLTYRFINESMELEVKKSPKGEIIFNKIKEILIKNL